jgi:hypothetical protein
MNGIVWLFIGVVSGIVLTLGSLLGAALFLDREDQKMLEIEQHYRKSW